MSTAAPRTATNWPIVFLLVGAGVIGGCHVGKVPAALPVLRADLGLSLVTAGWVLGMFNVIGLVTGGIARSLWLLPIRRAHSFIPTRACAPRPIRSGCSR